MKQKKNIRRLPALLLTVCLTVAAAVPAGAATKYPLTGTQSKQIASVCVLEAGNNVNDVKDMASFTVNYVEKFGGKTYAKSGAGITKFALNSGWFAKNITDLAKKGYVASGKAVASKYVTAVNDVIVKGKRTLPVKVIWFGSRNDLVSAKTGTKAVNVRKGTFVSCQTKLTTAFGQTYTYWSSSANGKILYAY